MKKRQPRKTRDHEHRPVGDASTVSMNICMDCGELVIGMYDSEGVLVSRASIRPEEVAMIISGITLRYHNYARKHARPVAPGEPLILN